MGEGFPAEGTARAKTKEAPTQPCETAIFPSCPCLGTPWASPQGDGVRCVGANQVGRCDEQRAQMPPLPWAEQSIARHHLLLPTPIIRLPYLFIVCLSSSECAYMLGRFSRVQLFVTPWTAARQAPLLMALSQQEDWGGLPFSPSGSLLFHDLNPDHHPPPWKMAAAPLLAAT